MNTQSELHSLLSNIPNPTSVTLTCKQRYDGCSVDEIVVSRNIRHFLNVLNQRVFGKKFVRFKEIRLKVVPIIEVDRSHRFHTHITLEKPTNLSDEEFTNLIVESWRKTNIGHQQFDVQTTYNIDGWTDYILKRRTKKTTVVDSVDWENVTL